MAKEGLALLDAAAKLHTKGAAPMGISWNALALNNRGYALLVLGHPKQAKPFLVKAEQAEPLLSEARQNLDAADQCNWVMLPGGSRGNPPVIADPPQPRHGEPKDMTTNSGGDPIPVASSFLDLSQGTEYQPVVIKIPDSPVQGSAMSDYYEKTIKAFNNEFLSYPAKITAADRKWNATHPNHLTDQRVGAIEMALATAEWQPTLKPLLEVYKTAFADLFDATHEGALHPGLPESEAERACWSSADWVTCMRRVCIPKTASLQASWRARMLMVNDLNLRWEAAYWRYATALAANVSNPFLHQMILLEATNRMLGYRLDVLIEARYWTGRADGDGLRGEGKEGTTDYCTGTPPPPPAAGKLPDQNDSKACPPALKFFEGSFTVPKVFKLVVACERVEAEFATPGWLGAFANGSYNPKSGQLTVFAGGQMEGGVKGAVASGKVGGFMTIDRDGAPIDGGIRVSGDLTIGVGGVGITSSATLDLGVAGAIEWPK
jgi:hypothetical protein